VVFVKSDDEHTKMLLESGEGRVFRGTISTFDPWKWTTYGMASRNRYKLHKSDADSLAGGFVDI
jgi:hypothetical protein